MVVKMNIVFANNSSRVKEVSVRIYENVLVTLWGKLCLLGGLQTSLLGGYQTSLFGGYQTSLFREYQASLFGGHQTSLFGGTMSLFRGNVSILGQEI